jgi:hypothetical protein
MVIRAGSDMYTSGRVNCNDLNCKRHPGRSQGKAKISIKGPSYGNVQYCTGARQATRNQSCTPQALLLGINIDLWGRVFMLWETYLWGAPSHHSINNMPCSFHPAPPGMAPMALMLPETTLLSLLHTSSDPCLPWAGWSLYALRALTSQESEPLMSILLLSLGS